MVVLIHYNFENKHPMTSYHDPNLTKINNTRYIFLYVLFFLEYNTRYVTDRKLKRRMYAK